MKRVALLHANNDLAQQLSRAIDQHTTGWEAVPHCATVSHTTRRDQLRRLWHVARGDYESIQADELVGNGPFATLLGRLTNTPVVGYMRGYGDYTNKHGQYGIGQRNKIRAKARLCFSQMDRVAAISEAVKAGVADYYPSHDCPVIERPYDVKRYASGDVGASTTTDIVTVTNLRYQEKYEGVRVAVDAISWLLNLYPDLSYHVAGAGRHLDALQADLADIERMHALGWVDDVPGLLAQADIFLYVSFLDGRPSAVYEAQAAGLPVVGGDASGVPEAVGAAGYVVPPTPQGVRAGLTALLDDADERQRLARASQDKMAHHNARVAQDWVQFWESVV